MRDLSERQASMLTFVREYTKRKGYPPNFREIMDGCDVSSTSVVHYNLGLLQRRGYIAWDRGQPRSIVLVAPEGAETAEGLLAELLEAYEDCRGMGPIFDRARIYLGGVPDAV